MSAYAFPGLLPPVTSEKATDIDSPNCAEPSDRNFKMPLHQQNETSFSGLLRASVNLLSVPSFTGGSDSFDLPKTDKCSSRTSTSDDTRLEEPGIAVKEAKIDPVRLVQNVTSRGQKDPRKVLRRRGSRERLSCEKPPTSPQSSPRSTKETVLMEHPAKHPSNPKAEASPHDDAIAFELSISLNGRKYTATRTLQCILQLRDDLIQEMNNRRRWLNGHQTVSAQSSSCPHDVPESLRTSSLSPSSSFDDGTVEIPEIPPLSGEDSQGNTGFVGRGFSMLHAMATCYVPVLDGWLRNIVTIVPQDSECLTNFLWEPLSNEKLAPELPGKSCTSLATLGSIKELDYHTDDSDSEDNW